MLMFFVCSYFQSGIFNGQMASKNEFVQQERVDQLNLVVVHFFGSGFQVRKRKLAFFHVVIKNRTLAGLNLVGLGNL